MGRKVVVDASLIKELCENWKITKNTFKGQLKIDPEDEQSKTSKKTEEIKRLLVSGVKKKSENKSARKRRRSPPRRPSPKRFRQNSESAESGPSSDSSDSFSEIDSEAENALEKDFSDCDSDDKGHSTGEIE